MIFLNILLDIQVLVWKAKKLLQNRSGVTSTTLELEAEERKGEQEGWKCMWRRKGESEEW